MKPDELLDKIFSAMRAERPDVSRVEAGFEARVMARIRAGRAAREREAPWYAWAWRLAPVFTALVLALGAWYYITATPDRADMRSAITADYEYSLAQNFWSGD